MGSKYLRNLLLFVTLAFIAYPVLCLTVNSINWSYHNKKKSNFNSRHNKNNVYQNWYHLGYCLELISVQNHGHRYNKNGVLVYAQWLLLLDEFNQLEIKDKKFFHKLVRNLESFKNGKKIKGIYNSGGPLLWFVRYQSLNNKIEHVSFKTILSKKLYPIHYGKNRKTKIFKTYYRNPNHSNRTLASIKEKIGKTEN